MPTSQDVISTTASATSENRLFYPALDGLRAVALLLVFFQHYIDLPWGWTGVEIFFVLSGFLITGILFDTRNTLHRVRNFYMRRALRIFPLYYGITLLVLLCWPVLHWNFFSWMWLLWPAYLGNYLRFIHPFAPHSIREQLADLQLVGHLGHQQVRLIFGHFWSLCVEEQFYLVWPWAVFLLHSRRTLVWICAASIPVCLIARLLCERQLPSWMVDNEVLQRVTPLHLDALLVGGLMALLLRGTHAATLLRVAAPTLLAATIAILVWAILMPAHHLFANPYPQPRHVTTFGLTFIDLYAACIILTAIQPTSHLFRFLSLRPLRWLGRISYGDYVFHDAPHALYSRFAVFLAPHHTTWATTVIALVCTLLLADLSYRFFETPFLQLKGRFTAGVPRTNTATLPRNTD